MNLSPLFYSSVKSSHPHFIYLFIFLEYRENVEWSFFLHLYLFIFLVPFEEEFGYGGNVSLKLIATLQPTPFFHFIFRPALPLFSSLRGFFLLFHPFHFPCFTFPEDLSFPSTSL